MTKPWHLVVLGVVFAMLFGLVGSFDYQDAQASYALYCEMVKEGSWSAYDKAIDCVNEGTGKQQKISIVRASTICQNNHKQTESAKGAKDETT